MGRLNTQGTISDKLIIVLHCYVHRHRTRVDMKAQTEDWALMAALQVAERGQTVRDKRIGKSHRLVSFID